MKMDVILDRVDEATSTAMLRVVPAFHGQPDATTIARVTALAKMELGLPKSANLNVAINGSEVHVEILKKMSSSASELLPNVAVNDVYSMTKFNMYETLPNRLTKAIIALVDESTDSFEAVEAMKMQALEYQKQSKKRVVHFVVLHTTEGAVDRIIQEKWFYPQQSLHHYQIAGDALAKLRTNLMISSLPYFLVVNNKHHVVAHGDQYPADMFSGQTTIPVATKPAPNSLPSPNLPAHDYCHDTIFPDIEVVPLPAPNATHTKSLFSLLVPTKYTVLDFWSTTCVKCPVAMEAFVNHHARSLHLPLQYVLINTDDPIKAWERVQANYKNAAILHLHVTRNVKESLKHFLGMKQLPHHVFLNPQHQVIRNGKYFSWDFIDGFIKPLSPSLAQKQPQLPLPDHDACLHQILPDTLVLQLSSREEFSLHSLLAKDSIILLGFWSTTSMECSEAIQKLINHQRAHGLTHVQYILINTDDADKAWKLVQEKKWHQSSIVHLHAALTIKNPLQSFFGIKQFPHHVLLNKDHQVISNGKLFSYIDADKYIEALMATKAAMKLTPSTPHPHDACHTQTFPNITAIDMATQKSVQLWKILPEDRTCTVIDFWTTTCTKCPQAVSTLLQHASDNVSKTIQYVLINCDDNIKGWTIAKANGWTNASNVLHLHVSMSIKDELKALLGIKQFPHHVLLDASNAIKSNGKYFSYSTVDEMASPRLILSCPSPSSARVFVLDDDF